MSALFACLSAGQKRASNSDIDGCELPSGWGWIKFKTSPPEEQPVFNNSAGPSWFVLFCFAYAIKLNVCMLLFVPPPSTSWR